MTPFADNLSYIKAELSWLDRVVTKAISRQKQTNQDVGKVARNNTDRATSHWWKGFVTIDPALGGKQLPQQVSHPGAQQHPLGRYGERIEASQQSGVFLPLPALCQHFCLTEFEKNTILLALAPEISRRYEKLFVILNEDETDCRLPTIDLTLRLFSRSDKEWQTNRKYLLSTSPLAKKKLVTIIKRSELVPTFLSQCLCVPEKYVHFLLGEASSLAPILPRPRRPRTATLPDNRSAISNGHPPT